MPLDPNRAAFVRHEFRYETESDPDVKALYENAREIVIETQLNSANAATLANTVLNDLKTFPETYRVPVDRLFSLEDFDQAPPQFIFNSVQYATDGRTSRCVAIEVDYAANTSVVVIRG